MAATNPQPGSLGFGRYNGQNVPIKVQSDGTVVTSGGGGGGGAVTIADGADVTEGAIADASVTGDNTGTVSAKLRGINKIWANVWDSINSRLNVYIQNTSIAATQSGTWTVQPGNTANTTAWKVDGSAVTQPVSGSVTVTQGTATSLKAQAETYQGGTAVGAGNPLQVSLANTGANATAVATSTPLVAAPLVGQAKIAVTSTRVQLGSNALSNGVIITALSTNTAKIAVGGSAVTNTVDGTGNGYILEAGSSASFAVSNTNALYINGTAGDIVSFAGS